MPTFILISVSVCNPYPCLISMPFASADTCCHSRSEGYPEPERTSYSLCVVLETCQAREAVEVYVSNHFLHSEAVPLHYGIALRLSRHSNHFHSPEHFVSPLGKLEHIHRQREVCVPCCFTASFYKTFPIKIEEIYSSLCSTF